MKPLMKPLIKPLTYIYKNPCQVSSIVLVSTLPFTIYRKNYGYLITQMPISCTTFLYHHNFNIKNIKIIDITIGQFAFWHHFLYAIHYNNILSIFAFTLCPILYAMSQYLKYNQKIHKSNIIHSFIHYCLSIAALSLNAQNQY
jgi:hypothetical protein